VSSILKALQRVEEERPAGASSAPRRVLRGDFAAEKGKPLLRRARRRQPNLRVWASLGAIGLLALLVWWRLPERSAPEVVAARTEARPSGPVARAEPPRAEAPAEPVTRAEPALAPPAQEEPAPPPAPEEALARGAEPPPAPAPEAAAPAEVRVVVAAGRPPLGAPLDAPAPAPARVEPAPAQTAPVPPAPPPPATAAAPEPKPGPEPVRAAPAPPVARVARTAPAPARPAPVAAKPAPKPPPSAPAVLVERTSWHPSAERRVAWVSVAGISGTRELHEGDAVGAFVVKEIRPSSVVFLHGADTLQRRVGTRE
jgi:hypothetical protein